MMYQYQIVINRIRKENEKHPMTIEESEKIFSEKKYRDRLYDTLDELREAYDAVSQEEVEKQMKKQLTLILRR